MGVGGFVVAGSDVVIVLMETRQTDRRDLVEGFDLVFSLFVIVDISVCLPVTSAVFDFDVGRHTASSNAAECVGNAGAVADDLLKGKSGGNHDDIIIIYFNECTNILIS